MTKLRDVHVVCADTHLGEDVRTERVHREQRDDVRGEEHSDENHSSEIDATKQFRVRRGARLGGNQRRVGLRTPDLPADPLRVGLAALAQQPPRRFRRSRPHQQGDDAEHRGAGQHQPPGVRAQRRQGPAHRGRRGRTRSPHHEQRTEQPAAVAARDEFGQKGTGDRIVGADRHPEQETQHHQLPRVGHERRRDGHRDQHGKVGDIHDLAAHAVGDVSEDQSADEDTDQCRGTDQADVDGVETQPVLHGDERDADDGQCEPVEERSACRKHREPLVECGQRSVVDQLGHHISCRVRGCRRAKCAAVRASGSSRLISTRPSASSTPWSRWNATTSPITSRSLPG